MISRLIGEIDTNKMLSLEMLPVTGKLQSLKYQNVLSSELSFLKYSKKK